MIIDSSLLLTIQKNPLLAAGIGLWSAAMLSYFTKDLPLIFWKLLKRQFTVSIEIPSNESTFKAITQWLEEKEKTKVFRSLRLREGKISAGLGKQYFFHQSRIWWIERERLDKPLDSDLEEISIGCFTINQNLVREFLDTAKSELEVNDRISIYFNDDDFWRFRGQQDKRNLNSVLLQKDKKIEIIDHLTRFFNSREWYKIGGIPFRTGLCLYGPPGTGKTSLVKAIASHFNLNIYVLDLNSQSDQSIQALFSKLPDKCVVLIEDIDTFDAVKTRTKSSHEASSAQLTLGGLLNAIDGIIDSNGRILVMTTNHIERLDPALIRPGRCDKTIELTYLTDETFRLAFKKFYPNFQIPAQVMWQTGVTPAILQIFVLNNKNRPDRLLHIMTQKKTVITDSNVINFGL